MDGRCSIREMLILRPQPADLDTPAPASDQYNDEINAFYIKEEVSRANSKVRLVYKFV